MVECLPVEHEALGVDAQDCANQAQLLIAVIQAVWMPRWEDWKFKVILAWIVSSRLAETPKILFLFVCLFCF